MTDLTVDEYKGFSEEELGQILQAEIIHMFHSNSSENDFGGAYSYLYTPFLHKHKVTDFIFRYGARIINFIYSKIPKIFSNLARIGF